MLEGPGMKKIAQVSVIAVLLVAACSRARDPRPPRVVTAAPAAPAPARAGTSAQWNAYWYAGKAELTRYELEQARYGEIHRGDAVLIFVTEPFLPDKQVKSDRGAVPGSVNVLKLNLMKHFNTGLYPYSLMTSVFTPVAGAGKRPSFKVSMSAQDWCGHAYLQLNLRGDRYRVVGHSYFEDHADQRYAVARTLLEDEVWTRIRLDPGSLPTGKLKVIPGTLDGRLRHHKVRVENAVASLETKGALRSYSLRYPDSKRSLTIRFEGAFPYRIVGWEETYRSGWGARAKVLTTRARKTHSLYVPYWKLNRVKDLPLRKKLGLH